MAMGLLQIRRQLQNSLSNPAMFSLVNTRVMLRTGVDLIEIAPADEFNAAKISSVLTALKSMGFPMDASATGAAK